MEDCLLFFVQLPKFDTNPRPRPPEE
jgi:hypothetical protein